MQTVDERPETIHLYVVREEAPKPQLFPIFLSMAALSVLFTLCILSPYQQPEERAVIRIPAVFLPLRVFTASAQIIPTGVKTIPATIAHGILTITNGSVISQTIPKGFTVSNVATDSAVFIPAGSVNGYGYAVVRAHALINGKGGNFATFTINQVEGSSVYIRNLSPFVGGRDSHSIKVETPHDRQTALDSARAILAAQITQIKTFLAFPCNESSQEKNGLLWLSWTCQYVTYSIPSYMHVVHIKLVGKNLLVDVKFVARPRIIQFK